MKKLLLLAAIIALITISCELERNNPLDPDNNGDVVVPSAVVIDNITVSGSGSTSKWVQLEWSRSEDAAFYLIYRALEYDGAYTNLFPDGIPNTSDSTTYYYIDSAVHAGNYYWYRLAGRSKEGLIGPLSAPRGMPVD